MLKSVVDNEPKLYSQLSSNLQIKQLKQIYNSYLFPTIKVLFFQGDYQGT